ncbi:MAG TPA: DUF4190 domain-containing protein [Phycisphaerales bacterium]
MTAFPAPADGRDFDWGPQRTSILAILALVFALPCFVPGVGFIASLLAVFALVGIASSKGRVGGTGLAVAALVLGLISTAFWGALGYGAWQVVNKFSSVATAPAVAVITAAEKGDFAAARNGVVQYTADQLTDERLGAFRQEVNDKLGAFQGSPQGLFDLFSAYGEISGLMQPPPKNGEPQLPIPLRFEKGAALILLDIDPTPEHAKDPVKSKILPIRNITIVTSDRSKIYLVDPALLPKSNWNGNFQIETDGTMTQRREPVKIKAGDEPAADAPEPAKDAKPPETKPADPTKPGGA